MAYYIFQWTDEMVAHLAEHGVSPDDFEAIVCGPESLATSRRTGRIAAFGHAADGRYLIALYELLDDGITVLPWSSYEVPEPRP